LYDIKFRIKYEKIFILEKALRLYYFSLYMTQSIVETCHEIAD